VSVPDYEPRDPPPWRPDVPHREVVHQEDEGENDRYDNIFLNRGEASALSYPAEFFTDTDLKAWRKEVRERVARKRPLGFG
jgi:hypothetical protein